MMPTIDTHSDRMHYLRALAAAVHAVDAPPAAQRLSARAAAQCLSGAARLLGLQYGVEVMRRACADLVAHAPAWRTSLRSLPMPGHAAASRAASDLAILARGILPMAGAENTRAALAFWACETDAATMMQFAA